MEQARKARTYGRMDYLDDPSISHRWTDTAVVWRPTEFDGYEVSSDGSIRSQNGVLCPYMTGSKGKQYQTVTISKKNIKVHRLVASAFLPKRVGANHVNHIDGNRANNSASNLEWVSQSENSKHAYRVIGAKVQTVHWWRGGGHKGKLGVLHHCSKPVMATLPNGETIRFAAAAEAARILGLSRGSVVRTANGVYKTTKGHRFAWI